MALDSLYNIFEITITPFLYSRDKDLEKIQQIVTSTKTTNIAKQATGQTTMDLSMMIKKKFENRLQ